MRIIYRPKKKTVVGGYGLLYNFYATQTKTNVEFGYLYNWYAATDANNIAASGWHLPSESEFQTLADYLGASGDYSLASSVGVKLKYSGTSYWDSPNSGSDNSSGWNGKGSGIRNYLSGSFISNKQSCVYCASNASSGGLFFKSASLVYNQTGFGVGTTVGLQTGMNIRLIKDDSTLTPYVGNDGKLYKTVKIGSQVWLAEDLMETKYRTGDPIPEVTDNSAWAALTTGARCSYNNTESNAGTSTKITSSDDWVVPTQSQWEILLNNIDVFDVGNQDWELAGGELKETGTSHWDSPNAGATNEHSFSLFAGGKRESVFGNIRSNSFLAILDEFSETEQKYVVCSFNNPAAYIGQDNKIQGVSIRLLYTGVGTPTSYTQNDGTVISVVQIGSQYWTAQNLKETKWRDGSYIHGYEGGVYTPISDVYWAALTTAGVCCYDDNTSNI